MEELTVPTIQEVDGVVETWKNALKDWAETDGITSKGVRSYIAVSNGTLIQELRHLVFFISSLNTRYETLRRMYKELEDDNYSLKAETANLRQQLARAKAVIETIEANL